MGSSDQMKAGYGQEVKGSVYVMDKLRWWSRFKSIDCVCIHWRNSRFMSSVSSFQEYWPK